MGYDIHITRKTDWFDDEPEIPLAEWIALVESDPEMRHDGYAEAKMPDGSVIRQVKEGISVWTAYSKPGSTAWFSFSNGNVVAKNPDEEILTKMRHLARALSAKVQGDEGELY